MAIDKVKAYFAEFGREGDVMEFPTSSATVELAAQAVGCEPARIAKTLSFAVGDRVALALRIRSSRPSSDASPVCFPPKRLRNASVTRWVACAPSR